MKMIGRPYKIKGTNPDTGEVFYLKWPAPMGWGTTDNIDEAVVFEPTDLTFRNLTIIFTEQKLTQIFMK